MEISRRLFSLKETGKHCVTDRESAMLVRSELNLLPNVITLKISFNFSYWSSRFMVDDVT